MTWCTIITALRGVYDAFHSRTEMFTVITVNLI